jgi:hypothetical protein
MPTPTPMPTLVALLGPVLLLDASATLVPGVIVLGRSPAVVLAVPGTEVIVVEGYAKMKGVELEAGEAVVVVADVATLSTEVVGRDTNTPALLQMPSRTVLVATVCGEFRISRT